MTELPELLSILKPILEADRPMTVRQCFYRLVSIGKLENCRPDYQRVSRLLTSARHDGAILWSWITDRSRPVYRPSTWANPADWLGEPEDYRRDPWQEQRNYVEV